MNKGLIVLALAVTGGAAEAQTISYPDFSNVSGLQINGNAYQNGNKLTLTPAAGWQGGSAFSQTTVALAANASFSTVFSFQILGRGGADNGADGLTFTVQTTANNVGGTGGGIGYQGLGNSVAVEFDTYNNGEFGGSNHVGIDLNGNMTSIASSPFQPIDFDNGSMWWAWVDYNGAAQQMDVRWAQSSTRPLAAMLSATGLNLASVLGNPNVYVGFTSGTGAGWGEHDITSWNFVNSFQQGGAPDPLATPEPATFVLMATGMGLVGLVARRRKIS